MLVLRETYSHGQGIKREDFHIFSLGIDLNINCKYSIPCYFCSYKSYPKFNLLYCKLIYGTASGENSFYCVPPPNE